MGFFSNLLFSWKNSRTWGFLNSKFVRDSGLNPGKYVCITPRSDPCLVLVSGWFRLPACDETLKSLYCQKTRHVVYAWDVKAGEASRQFKVKMGKQTPSSLCHSDTLFFWTGILNYFIVNRRSPYDIMIEVSSRSIKTRNWSS